MSHQQFILKIYGTHSVFLLPYYHY